MISPRGTVLIADDDRQMRIALRARLSAFGYRIIEANDGQSALRACASLSPHVVVLDHDMPNGDGRSVARQIRDRGDTPIIFLSGHACEDFRPIVMQLPDVYYLTKPLVEGKLLRLLNSIMTSAPTAT